MKATMILNDRYPQGNNDLVSMRVFKVPNQVRGSGHDLKYSLAYMVDGICVLRFDNEAEKGDHLHLNDVEKPYVFTTLKQLLADFWAAVDDLRQ